MKIDHSNYEVYMIDYLDGRLGAVEVAELLLFAEQYPEVKKELELLTGLDLDVEKEKIDKLKLKKPVYADIKHAYEEKLVAALEGDLDVAEQVSLNRMLLVYPELRRDAALFGQTKLEPDYAVVFKGKKQLRKGAVVLSLYVSYAWRAAALVAVFALIAFLVKQPQEQLADAPLPMIHHAEPGKKMANSLALPGKKITGKEKAAHKNIQPFLKRATRKTPVTKAKEWPVIQVAEVEMIANKPVKHIDAEQAGTNLLKPLHNPLAFLPYTNDPTATNEKSFKDFPQFAAERIKENTGHVLIERNKPADGAEKKVTFSDFGLLFVTLYNKATGDHAKVVRTYDTTGNVVGIGVVAANFQFSTGK